MSQRGASSERPTERARRVADALNAIDGVVGVKVWETPSGLAVGVRVGLGQPVSWVLSRVDEAAMTLRDPDEPAWEVGLLAES